MWITFIVIIIIYIYIILPAVGDKVGTLVGNKVGTIYIIIRIVEFFCFEFLYYMKSYYFYIYYLFKRYKHCIILNNGLLNFIAYII